MKFKVQWPCENPLKTPPEVKKSKKTSTPVGRGMRGPEAAASGFYIRFLGS